MTRLFRVRASNEAYKTTDYVVADSVGEAVDLFLRFVNYEAHEVQSVKAVNDGPIGREGRS